MNNFSLGDTVGWKFHLAGMDFPDRFGEVVAMEDNWVVIRNHKTDHTCPLHVMHVDSLYLAQSVHEGLRMVA